MKTFWLVVTDERAFSDGTSVCTSLNDDEPDTPAEDHGNSRDYRTNKRGRIDNSTKTQRLVDWNAEVLLRLLRQIMASRKKSPKGAKTTSLLHWDSCAGSDATVLDEVKEIIELPKFTGEAPKSRDDSVVVIDKIVENQLRDYITAIANLYQANPFHNFEHASHVTMVSLALYTAN